MRRHKLYPLLSALYITQLIGVGFLFVGLTGILRQEGASLDTLSIIPILGVLWAIKFLWSPIVDRFGGTSQGHYRLWLLVLQTGMVATILAMLGVEPDPDNLGPLLGLSALLVLFSSTQDIAADAIAVRLIGHKERGTANGIQAAASYIGNLLGGGLTVIVYDQFGWSAAILLLALMTAMALIVVISFKENEGPNYSNPKSLRKAYASMRTVFRQPGASRWAFLVVPLLWLGVGVTNALLTPALVDLGWSLTRIGLVITLVSSAPAAIGGLVGGWMVTRYGRLFPVTIATVFMVIATLALIPMFSGIRNDALIIIAICIYKTSYALATAAIFTVNMDFSRVNSAGSDYSILSSIGFIFSMIAGSVGLAFAESLGYLVVAISAPILLIIGLIAYNWHLKGHNTFLENEALVRESTLVKK